MSNTHKDLMICTVIGIILVFTGIYLNDSITALIAVLVAWGRGEYAEVSDAE